MFLSGKSPTKEDYYQIMVKRKKVFPFVVLIERKFLVVSVRDSITCYVGRSVSLQRLAILAFNAPVKLIDKPPYCSSPPVRDLGSRVSGLVEHLKGPFIPECDNGRACCPGLACLLVRKRYRFGWMVYFFNKGYGIT